MTREFWIGTVLLLAGRGWAADTIQPLNITPGLWEIALTVKTSGIPPMPPEVREKLTAGQRARIDEKAKEKAAEGARTTIKRSCLEAKDLGQPFIMAFGGDRQNCRQKVASSSTLRQEIHVECGKDPAQGGGTVLIEVLDPKNAKVTSQWSATDGAHTVKISSTAKLKWLGAVCEGQAGAAAKSAPEGAGHYYQVAKEQIGREEFWEALRTLNKAIELDAKQAVYYNARGYAYLRLRSYANAILEFSEAIRLQPEYPNALRNRATARRRSGDTQGADADERKAAELENRR